MNAFAIPQLELPAIPPMREWVERHARVAAAIVTGPVEFRPERLAPHFQNTVYMAAADLVLTATACSRPLLLKEMRSVARQSGLDAMILRVAQCDPVTFDIYMQQADRWLVATRLWIHGPNQQAWFVPSTTGGPAVRASALGLETSDAPYNDEDERRVGLQFASIAFAAALTRRF